MAGLGFYFIALFATGFVLSSLRRHETRRYLWVALFSLPLPWVAAELGWILAEVGRQPWIIEGVLPTFLGVSSLAPGQIIATMVGFTVLYGALAVVEVMLMIHLIQKGPYPEKDGRPLHIPRPGSGADPLPAE